MNRAVGMGLTGLLHVQALLSILGIFLTCQILLAIWTSQDSFATIQLFSPHQRHTFTPFKDTCLDICL